MSGSGAPLGLGAQLLPAGDVAALARQAEEAGFGYLFSGEHVSFHRDGQSALVRLAAAAGATAHIRLASAVVLAALYPPVLLAWLVTSVDRAAGGRFELGVGAGGEFTQEFAALGIDPTERGARLDESLTLLRRLWTETDVTFEGRFTSLSGVTLQPGPVHGDIPVWVGGRKETAMRRAGRSGDGWMPYLYTPERLASSIERVRAHAGEVGRDPTAIRHAIYVQLTADEDGNRARRTSAEWLEAAYRQDLRHVVGRYTVAGTPDECVARLREYHDAGAEIAFIPFACPPGEREPMFELVRAEVVPAFALATADG